MPVRLRLQVQGLRNNRHFKIVAARSKTRRQSDPIEVLGWYMPHLRVTTHRDTTAAFMAPYKQQLLSNEPHNDLEIDFERVKYWIGQGAELTQPVHKLLSYAGLVPPLPYLPKERVPAGDEAGRLRRLREWEAAEAEACS
eukprot:TRINITY_DN8031_c0_g1_i3.p2 TRINITY_DN8031_c0_g1~~TRINITY_DN8031_c0_g1_i3.p2  ORF type:complete len:140 (-),score=31.45 TRINITY_DN8031_c0_g1_i3:73-492(-)